MIFSFFVAFVLTNIIEFIPFNFFVKEKIEKKVFYLLLINSITLPIIWFFLPLFFENYIIFFILFELLIFFIESILIKIFLKKDFLFALKLSFIMNFLSALIGFILF
jgi:hypothetical protein